MLLSASGRDALRCSLRQMKGESPQVSTMLESQPLHQQSGSPDLHNISAPLTIHGTRHWYSLAAVGSSATEDQQGYWALDVDGAIVQLQHRLGAEFELLRVLELQPRESVVNAAQLHVLRGEVLLGLERSGLLQTWHFEGGDARSWRLRSESDLQWLGICSLDSDLYALRSPSRGSASLWRVPMPKELSRAIS